MVGARKGVEYGYQRAADDAMGRVMGVYAGRSVRVTLAHSQTFLSVRQFQVTVKIGFRVMSPEELRGTGGA